MAHILTLALVIGAALALPASAILLICDQLHAMPQAIVIVTGYLLAWTAGVAIAIVED